MKQLHKLIKSKCVACHALFIFRRARCPSKEIDKGGVSAVLIPRLSPLKPLKAGIKMSRFLSPSLIDGGYCSYPRTLNPPLLTL